MPTAASVLAESLRLDPGIPPWMTAVMVAVWLGIVVMAVTLWRHRRAARRAVRIEQQGRHSGATRARPPAPPDDRQLGPGTDVEVW